jgi:hypothetical protein
MSIRVIQWTSGQIGRTCLRAVIDHPDLELVGLFTHSDRKAGRDAGEIARRPPTGVLASTSVEEMLALDADVVLHLPLNPPGAFPEHDETIKKLLRSGKNVITTVAYTFPPALGQDYTAGFDEAGRDGNATLFGTGINPGFITERITTTLTGACVNVSRIQVSEYFQTTFVPSAPMVFDMMGTGRPVEEIEQDRARQDVFRHIFSEVVAYAGHAMGQPWDEIRADHQFAAAPRDTTLAAGVVKAGGAINFRWRFHGMRAGTPLLTQEQLWIGDPSLPGWDHTDGWEIQIDGAPSIRTRVDLCDPVGTTDRTFAIQYAVAGPVIRAIPEVVKAPAGVLIAPTFAPFTHRM